ncbi:MAG: GMC family oxidoreductase [Lewinellaceae bacterium]|nr:GMC family oxidoreductase [Lewinellaceae bacterium]
MEHKTFSSVNINTSGAAENTFDAIVVGSGISGGWAAKELCEKGLKTLVLERGRNVDHVKDYPTATMKAWEFPHRLVSSQQTVQDNPIISRAAGYGEDTEHFFVKDKDHPYVQQKDFVWVRGYQVGGKSLIWGRACPRWSPYEFDAPARLGYGLEWPIRYEDVAPWYSHVERFIGVCGNRDGIESMPDGEFLPPFVFNSVELSMKTKINARYGNRYMVQGRWAHVTEPNEIHQEQGRGKCQARNKCMRGCPFGAYFSSNSSTLPWAAKTGNLTVRPFSVAHSIIYDEQKGKAVGVRIVDTNTRETIDYFAKVIFMNASALNTNLILLHSKSKRFPDGIGNDSGTLGKYVGFHNYRGTIDGDIEGFQDKYYFGNNPSECMMPNFRNLKKQDTDFVGGYMAFMGAWRGQSEAPEANPQIGGAYKDALCEAGQWHTYIYMQGETILKASNRVYLSDSQKDQWGIPQLVTDVDYDDNDEKMKQDFLVQGAELLEAGGAKNINAYDRNWPPGLDIHEMGGCRMGADPKNSMLNRWNQMHACKNVFVTDGACMTSTGVQSPSIFYMALTARAVDYAVGEMKKGNL